jgi:hypothetical protein
MVFAIEPAGLLEGSTAKLNRSFQSRAYSSGSVQNRRKKSPMSTIAAAYLSYTAWSTSSQTSTAAAGVGPSGGGGASTSSASVSVSVTTVTISHRAKQLLARASAERSVIDRLQAQIDALLADRSASRRGRDAGASAGIDFFKIIGGNGDDIIRPYARPVAIDAGAGNDLIDTYGQARVDAGGGDDTVRTHGHSTVDGGDGNDHISTYDYSSVSGGNGNDSIATYGDSVLDGGPATTLSAPTIMPS